MRRYYNTVHSPQGSWGGRGDNCVLTIWVHHPGLICDSGGLISVLVSPGTWWVGGTERVAATRGGVGGGRQYNYQLRSGTVPLRNTLTKICAQ